MIHIVLIIALLLVLEIVLPGLLRILGLLVFFMIIYGIVAAVCARAMEFSGTCRGASAAVTSFSGFGTTHATMTGAYTRADAVEYCKREQHVMTKQCVADKLREGPMHAIANCKARTLTTTVEQPPWVAHYQFPVVMMCANDNIQAVAVFMTMCPAVEEKTLWSN
jgi:hypothetical protein